MYTFTILYNKVKTEHTVQWWWEWPHPDDVTWSNFIKYSRLSEQTKQLLEQLTDREKGGLHRDYCDAGSGLVPEEWFARRNSGVDHSWATPPNKPKLILRPLTLA